MGFLDSGEALDWPETLTLADAYRDFAVRYYLEVYLSQRDRQSPIRWGDEIEYIIVRVDHATKSVQLVTDAELFLNKLQDLDDDQVAWRPEYSSYMIEGIPREPFDLSPGAFRRLEENMRRRRLLLSKLCSPDEYILTIPTLWRMGCDDEAKSLRAEDHRITGSLYVSDALINVHPRFPTLTRNIRARRGRKISIHVPGTFAEAVHADAMVFGMGLCCLQCTFQPPTLADARYLYDQLGAIAPVALALTAGTPTLRGQLTDSDCRWQIIEASVDDRRADETYFGIPASTTPEAARQTPPRAMPVRRSRYGSIALYLDESLDTVRLNDLADDLPIDPTAYVRLLDAGVPAELARHTAYLLIRDPLVIYSHKRTYQPGASDGFECFQTTNWNSVRLKLPSEGAQAGGWRVEFRPMEVQPTDAENAAFVTFFVLLADALLAETTTAGGRRLDFRVPISLVDQNVAAAHARDAITASHFHWATTDHDATSRPRTVHQIINGAPGLTGLAAIVRAHLDKVAPDDVDAIAAVDFVAARASATRPSFAHWQRDFINRHPHYQNDGRVGLGTQYDLVRAVVGAARWADWERDAANAVGRAGKQAETAAKEAAAAEAASTVGMT